MTGDAPQPGTKPRDQGEPWSYTDANIAWWRADGDPDGDPAPDAEPAESAARPRRRRRPPPATPANAAAARPAAFAPEALDAHAAGAQDATRALDPPPAANKPAANKPAENGPAENKPAENEDGAEPAADLVPDVMVLPEPHPNRNRPTVALDREPVPGSSAGSSRVGGTDRRAPRQPTMDPARAELLENSPFWLSDSERAAAGSAWPAAATEGSADPSGPADGRGRPPRRPRTPRHPASGLAGLLTLSLVAAFFAWVSAEPFWLAAGHGDRGVATVTRCSGEGVTQRCSGAFTAADGSFTVERVTLLGVGPDTRGAGAVAPAKMVSADSGRAYVGSTGLLLHLRWALGFLLVLLCGYGIAGLTGARRLGSARARRAAVLTSLAGPVLLLAGFLAVAV